MYEPRPPSPCSSLRPKAWKTRLPTHSTPSLLLSLSASPLLDIRATHLVHAGQCSPAAGPTLPDRPSGSRLTGAAEVSCFYFQQTCFVYSNLFPLSFRGSDLRLKKKKNQKEKKTNNNNNKIQKPNPGSVPKSCLNATLMEVLMAVIISLVADWVNFVPCIFRAGVVVIAFCNSVSVSVDWHDGISLMFATSN